MYIYIIIFLITCNLYAGELFNDTLPIAGKVYHNWYFGYSTGITFMTQDEEAEYLEYGGNYYFGNSSSTISNRYGKYLLQSDGLYFIDNLFMMYDSVDFKKHEKDITFGQFVSNGSIMIPLQNDRVLHITNVRRQEYFNEVPTRDLQYSILEYNSILKRFEFISRSNELISNLKADAIGATYNAVTNKYIMMLYDVRGINYFFEFDLNGDLLRQKSQETFSTKRVGHGDVVFNPMGDKVAFMHSRNSWDLNEIEEDYTEIYLADFDPISLEMNNIRRIKIDSISVVRAQFSFNSKYLYFFGHDRHSNNRRWEEFYQYDVFNKSLRLIQEEYSPRSSEYFNGNTVNPAPANAVDLQLGPDRKIYIARTNANHLSVINTPDQKNSIGYEYNIIPFPRINAYKAFSTGCLPKLITASFADIYVKTCISICEGEDLELFVRTQLPDTTATYSWTGPNNFSSDEQFPNFENATTDLSGIYEVSVRTDTDVYYAETMVSVKEAPAPEINAYPSNFVCEDGDITLSINQDYESYLWSNGDTTKSIVVDSSGVYGLTVTHENGCESYAEVNVGFGNEYELQISGETEKCEGEEVTLTSTEEFSKYTWSNGDTTRSITVSEPDRYRLTVETKEGCILSKEIEVKNHPTVVAELNPTAQTICGGDSTLLESKYQQNYYAYLWSTNETTSSIYAKSSGLYKLLITDTRTGCNDSTEIEIRVEDNLEPTITGKDICDGGSATLTAIPNDPSYTYLWSTNETTPEIVVDAPGTYSVTVSKDGCVGTAEFTVNESPLPNFEINGEDILCGNPATLECDTDFEEYLWSTDETSKYIEVSQAGTYSLTVTDENGCETTKEFTVNESTLSFDLNRNSFNYGKLYLSDIVRDSIEFINTSGAEITIEHNNQTIILSDDQSYIINEILKVGEVGSIDKVIEIRIISPCDSTISIPVSAEVYAKLKVNADNLEAKIGEFTDIRIYSESNTELNIEDIQFEVEIADVYKTEDSKSFVLSSPISKGTQIVHEMSGMVLLSDDLEYEIGINPIKMNNPFVELEIQPGLMTIDSICMFDLRKIEYQQPVELKVTPNPAREAINISVIAETESQIKLELVSSEGKQIHSDNWTQSASEMTFTIPTDNIPSGVYQLRLQSNDRIITKQVIVVR